MKKTGSLPKEWILTQVFGVRHGLFMKRVKVWGNASPKRREGRVGFAYSQDKTRPYYLKKVKLRRKYISTTRN